MNMRANAWTAIDRHHGVFVLRGLRACGVVILGTTDGGREGITFWVEHETELSDETIMKAIDAAMREEGYTPGDIEDEDDEEEAEEKPVLHS